MGPATFTDPRVPRGIVRLRAGRLLCTGLGLVTLIGVGFWWVLHSNKPPSLGALTTDMAAWPAWLKQAQTYQAPAEPPKPVAPERDLLAEQLAALHRQLGLLEQELDALKKRPMAQPIQSKDPPPPKKPHSAMLFVAHEPKEAPLPPNTHTLTPGATKIPCVVETAMNSDVDGYFTAKVPTNVYDTVTGRHLLIPQGSSILGKYNSTDLLYGNQRLPTLALTLALPNGRTVDLGQSPVTDQQGVAGLVSRVDAHWWRLFGAVFIGGALKGGAHMLQLQAAQAGGVAPMAGGIAQSGGQLVHQRVGRALDTRPTIEIDAGQICNVLLTKPLHLPAMWGQRDTRSQD